MYTHYQAQKNAEQRQTNYISIQTVHNNVLQTITLSVNQLQIETVRQTESSGIIMKQITSQQNLINSSVVRLFPSIKFCFWEIGFHLVSHFTFASTLSKFKNYFETNLIMNIISNNYKKNYKEKWIY